VQGDARRPPERADPLWNVRSSAPGGPESSSGVVARRESADLHSVRVARKKNKKTTRRAPSARARDKAAQVQERLARAIPRPHVELRFQNAWQLLVATILAAQSTDRTVNRVMLEVLRRWPDPASLAKAPQEEVEQVILSTGFFRNKAKAIRAASAVIADRFGGQVPRTMDEMLELPGVARKTANVVLGAAYGVPSGIVVDTHAQRVAHRLGLARQDTPEKVEEALCGLFPRDEWIRVSHRLVLHGRHVCTSRAPRCEICPLNEICPSREAPPRGSWEERAEAMAREMESRAESFSRADARDAP
jgi:endonuclease III